MTLESFQQEMDKLHTWSKQGASMETARSKSPKVCTQTPHVTATQGSSPSISCGWHVRLNRLTHTNTRDG